MNEGFHKWGVPKNGWFIMENLFINGWLGGVPHGHGTPNLGNPYIHIYIYIHIPGIVSKKIIPLRQLLPKKKGSSLPRLWLIRISEVESVITTAWVSNPRQIMEMYAPAKTKDGNQGWSYLLHIGKNMFNEWNGNFMIVFVWLCGPTCLSFNIIQFRPENSWGPQKTGSFCWKLPFCIQSSWPHIARHFGMVWQPVWQSCQNLSWCNVGPQRPTNQWVTPPQDSSTKRTS